MSANFKIRILCNQSDTSVLLSSVKLMFKPLPLKTARNLSCAIKGYSDVYVEYMDSIKRPKCCSNYINIAVSQHRVTLANFGAKKKKNFVNCRQIMYLVISLLVLRAGYGI